MHRWGWGEDAWDELEYKSSATNVAWYYVCSTKLFQCLQITVETVRLEPLIGMVNTMTNCLLLLFGLQLCCKPHGRLKPWSSQTRLDQLNKYTAKTNVFLTAGGIWFNCPNKWHTIQVQESPICSKQAHFVSQSESRGVISRNWIFPNTKLIFSLHSENRAGVGPSLRRISIQIISRL